MEPYIDQMDPIVAKMRIVLEYGMEPERCSRVEQCMHLSWCQDKKCCFYRVVYNKYGQDYTTLIHEKCEQYVIEYVGTHNRDWHYIVNAHETKRGEDPYDVSAYVGGILFFKDIPLRLSSYPTTLTAYVC